MSKFICAAAFWLLAASLTFAQNPGTDAADKIAERVEAAETKSSDQKTLVKEIAEAARQAGKDHPKDADKVKEIVRKKMDEIRDRKSSEGKPGGKNNQEIEEWVKKLKRDLMDNHYVSLPRLTDTPLICSATGTGRTTGHIANLSLYNPTDATVSVEIGPVFIPSGGDFQPYIVPGAGTVSVPPHSTANVPLDGYCADIFTAPVPSGAGMPPVKNWIPVGESLPSGWAPSPTEGWKPVTGSSALIPGTTQPLGHTIDPVRHPTAAAEVLTAAFVQIAGAYDAMKENGAITTPFSGNPEKEREAVIQQTFWIYAAELTGKAYKMQDFSSNTVKQFEASTGQKFQAAPPATRDNVEQGVTEFWNTFEAVGVEAKVLTARG